MRYLIYCDESDDKGSFYSNFYGGALLKHSDRPHIEARLTAAKGQLGDQEFKWTKISPSNEAVYIAFVHTIFDLVEEDLLKLRIMFTQNIDQPTKQALHDEENEFFMLYYQFLKHAFGLQHCHDGSDEQTIVTVFLDDVPQTAKKFENFRAYLSGLTNYPLFFNARIGIPKSEITSVDSRAHIILQAVDVVLGSIQFRLNEKHIRLPLAPLSALSVR